jgi:hypothetical protein
MVQFGGNLTWNIHNQRSVAFVEQGNLRRG